MRKFRIPENDCIGLSPKRQGVKKPFEALACTNSASAKAECKIKNIFLKNKAYFHFSTLRHQNSQCRGLQAYIELFHSVEPVAVKMRRSL